MKKLISFFLAVAMLLGVLAVTVGAADSISSKVMDFKTYRYPDGSTYQNNPNATGGYECFGFANEMALYIFGSYPTYSMSARAGTISKGWTVVHGAGAVDNLAAGDIVRYDNHSIFITLVSGNNVYYAQANKGGSYNLVTYNNLTTKTDLKALVNNNLRNESSIKGWVAHYSGSGSGSTSGTSTDTCGCSTSYEGKYTTYDVSTGSYLNIRNAHSTSGTVVGKIPAGATFTVSKANGTWAHVTYNGVSGYASCDYMRRITSLTLSASGATTMGTTNTEAVFGQSLPTVKVPTKTNNTFLGYFSEDGTQYYKANGESARNWDKNVKSATLYAHWTTNTSTPAPTTIIFDMAGGTNGTSSTMATKGQAMKKITTPVKSGYTFGGYYSGTNGSGTQYYNANGESARNWDQTASSVTLHAKWTENQPAGSTVSFNLQGGTGGTDKVKAIKGKAMPSISVPTRSGYTFGGYYTEPNGKGTQYYYSSGSSAKNWDKTTSSFTLYAKWIENKPAEYMVILNSWYADTEGTTSVKVTYGKAMPSISKLPKKTGYTFGGYYDNYEGKGTQYYDKSGKSVKTWDKTQNNVTLYAKWTANNITVVFDAQGADIMTGTWRVTTTFGSKRNSITIPKKTGYTFEGYYTKPNGKGTQYYDENGSVIGEEAWKEDSLTLYANWVANTYKVVLDFCGGKDGDKSVIATYDEDMPKIQTPKRDGYTFGGYFTGLDGGGEQYYTEKGKSAKEWDMTQPITLHANWTEDHHGSASWSAINSGNGYLEYNGVIEVSLKDMEADTKGTRSVPAEYGHALPATITIPTKKGFTFGGYYTGTNGTGKQYYNEYGVSTQAEWLETNAILYAYWIKVASDEGNNSLEDMFRLSNNELKSFYKNKRTNKVENGKEYKFTITLTNSQKVDAIKFSPAESCVYEMYTVSEMDTCASLGTISNNIFTGYKYTEMEMNDNGGEGKNFKICEDLQKNDTYFLLVGLNETIHSTTAVSITIIIRVKPADEKPGEKYKCGVWINKSADINAHIIKDEKETISILYLSGVTASYVYCCLNEMRNENEMIESRDKLEQVSWDLVKDALKQILEQIPIPYSSEVQFCISWLAKALESTKVTPVEVRDAIRCVAGISQTTDITEIAPNTIATKTTAQNGIKIEIVETSMLADNWAGRRLTHFLYFSAWDGMTMRGIEGEEGEWYFGEEVVYDYVNSMPSLQNCTIIK